jgi:hypothetical protein
MDNNWSPAVSRVDVMWPGLRWYGMEIGLSATYLLLNLGLGAARKFRS